jgi:hypothetical protein
MSNDEQERDHAPGGWVSGPPSVAKFVLTWKPVDGDPIEVPIGKQVMFLGVPVTFNVDIQHLPISRPAEARIIEALRKATENPGNTFEAEQ